MKRLIRKASQPTVLYHGTSPTLIDTIASSGAIIPQASIGSEVADMGLDEEDYARLVFLTDDLDTASHYSMLSGHNSNFDGNFYGDLSIILEIDVTGLTLLPDTVDCFDCETWEDSLVKIHAVAVKGEIPTNRVKAVLLVNGGFVVRSTFENWRTDFEANEDEF